MENEKPKNLDRIIKELQAITPEDQISFLPGRITDKGAFAFPYLSREFVTDRLDSVCGAFGWKLHHGTEGTFTTTTIEIINPITGEWISKSDTGQENGKDKDKAKEIVTGGIKRAARVWGIGRDIGRLKSEWFPAIIEKDSAGKFKFKSWKTQPTIGQFLRKAKNKRIPNYEQQLKVKITKAAKFYKIPLENLLTDEDPVVVYIKLLEDILKSAK